MAACASQVRVDLTGNPGKSFGRKTITAGTAVFPTGSATATITVGLLTSQSIVWVRNTEVGDVKLIEIVASRTKGSKGTVTIGTVDGSSTSATRTFAWAVLNP